MGENGGGGLGLHDGWERKRTHKVLCEGKMSVRGWNGIEKRGKIGKGGGSAEFEGNRGGEETHCRVDETHGALVHCSSRVVDRDDHRRDDGRRS